MRFPPDHISDAKSPQSCMHQDLGYSARLRTKPTVAPKNYALLEIFALESISKSKGYGLNLVPLYDKNGTLIDGGKRPPYPWLRLPAPTIRTGKKLWDAEVIDKWHDEIRARALVDENASSDDCANGGDA
jgi:hypothetical protein